MIGSQEPRLRVEPARASSDGELAAMLMEAYAQALDPWQRLVVDCWLGKDAQGRPNVTTAGLSGPRQIGKNVCFEALELFGLAVGGERLIHTAHQVRTCKKSFRRLAQIFTDRRHPELMDMVRTIRYTNGEEAIELENGGMIEYMARSRQAARGFDGVSRIIFDEAQELTDDQLEAILATLSASTTGLRQLILGGTPPYPGCPGEVFRRIRGRIQNQPGPHDAWHEWSVAANSLAEIRLDDRTLWYMTNPAMGIRLTEDFTSEELRSMDAAGFARERLGWWSPVLAESESLAISAAAWDACRSLDRRPEGKTAYGVKFTVDGAEVCLCGAVIPQDGPARVSMIERRPTGRGIAWLSEWINERSKAASCVVIDGRNGADLLVENIKDTWRAKDAVIRPSSRNVIAAVSTITDAINQRTVTWYAGQPALRDSAVTSTKRPIGGGWGFGGENSIPIEAAALALWGAKTSKRDPTRKMRIG